MTTASGRGRPGPAGAGGATGTEPGAAEEPAGRGWTLLTSHGRVLLLIARQPDIRIRDIAEQARITERSATGIVSDLERAGYLTKSRTGRRNTYAVNADRAFRHPAEAPHHVGELIDIFTGSDAASPDGHVPAPRPRTARGRRT